MGPRVSPDLQRVSDDDARLESQRYSDLVALTYARREIDRRTAVTVEGLNPLAFAHDETLTPAKSSALRACSAVRRLFGRGMSNPFVCSHYSALYANVIIHGCAPKYWP